MNYTIAYTEDLAENLQLNFNKSGNEYVVELYNKESHECTRRHFKTIDDALTVYHTICDLMLKGYGSEEYKRNVLKGEQQ